MKGAKTRGRGTRMNKMCTLLEEETLLSLLFEHTHSAIHNVIQVVTGTNSEIRFR